MPELEVILLTMGMGQYHSIFVQAGFDAWETLLDITEDDLDALAVRRGHRRRLQQEIAHSLSSGLHLDDQQFKTLGRPLSNTQATTTPPGRKRQYTRHPDPDPNAPQRPPSAYALFSDATRKELNESNMSFAGKSKVTGEKWQILPEAAKQPWMQKAAGPWEVYKAEERQYQTTDAYRTYQTYVAEFHAANPPGAPKRRKAPDNEQSKQGEPSGVVKRSSSSDVRSLVTVRPLAPAPSPAVPKPYSEFLASSTKSNGVGESASPRSKSSPTTPAAVKTAQWFSHACESCKRKKVKCDGATPTCERCQKTNNECCYAGGVRDREKRLVENVLGKLNVWEDVIQRIKPRLEGEDRSEIDRLLTKTSRIPGHAKTPSDLLSNSSLSEAGESDASNVGSMGSTDHYNEDRFVAEGADDGQINAFLGQAATDNWVERLSTNLDLSERHGPKGDTGIPDLPDADPYSARSKASSATAGPSPTNGGTSTFGDYGEPYGLPVKTMADSFVIAYFSTVHPCFPMVSRAEFLSNYETFFASPTSNSASSSTFVPMLHLVLAIGAVHAYVTQASWATGERSRLLGFAKAKAAVLDASIFHATAYEQVQLCGLGGLYYLVMSEINKAWNVAGLGVRCAQALGLHLTNTTPSLTASQKNLRFGIWFSVLSLERTTVVITGRPSMVRDVDCSVILPGDGSVDPDNDLHSPMSSDNPHSLPQGWQHLLSSALPLHPNFFVHHAQLSSLADSALSRLYSPKIRHVKWSQLQLTIRELDQKLSDWNADLALPLQTDFTPQRAEHEPARIAIAMLFHSTRIIINRPCLCRLDDRIVRQSANSASINLESAGLCIASARAILALIPNQPDLDVIYQSPLWWMSFHHIKRAATVLILEITFVSEHTPAPGEAILADAKKAINWLHAMGKSSSPAYNSWVTLSHLLLRAARRFGGDVSDAVLAMEEHPNFAITGFSAAQEGDQGRPLPDAMFDLDAPGFQLGFGAPGPPDDPFGDFPFGAWDQFGVGQGTFFPAESERDKVMEDNEGSGAS
ncbi:MAG: hypothetical protein LQ345_002909 [Seirophora villosa]|nr:MAG: hypothetical protein LQ345_002909 [Seirophora villosa]